MGSKEGVVASFTPPLPLVTDKNGKVKLKLRKGHAHEHSLPPPLSPTCTPSSLVNLMI